MAINHDEAAINTAMRTTVFLHGCYSWFWLWLWLSDVVLIIGLFLYCVSFTVFYNFSMHFIVCLLAFQLQFLNKVELS